MNPRRPYPIADRGAPSTKVFLLLMLGVGAVSLVLPMVAERIGATIGSLVANASASGRPWILFALPLAILFGVVMLALISSRSSRRPSAELETPPRGTPPGARTGGQQHFRTIIADRPKTRFADVAGVEEAKEELSEVVEFLRSPEKFASLGARVPKGVLLVGAPGTGKTLLARAVAGEAGVPFISAGGSEFVELYVGVGASRVRALFQEARRQSPCIVFIDEIDAVGRRRGGNMGVSHEEREQTLNQILVEMDGFDPRTNVMVIAATNRADILDPALQRPGRFDRQVMLDLPDAKGRLEILGVHARGKPLDAGVDLAVVARNTSGLSGADLENLLNEAAIMAARRGLCEIGLEELEEALDRVMAGPRRRSRVLSEREKIITAYHEGGHALVAAALPHADPVHKISIISRGMAGGYTRFVPEQDRNMWTKSEFEAAIASALGGHVAEEMIFGEVTTGPSNDLQRATEMARRMVTEFGMSKEIGPLALGSAGGYEGAEYRGYGDEIARQVDAEVRRVMATAHARACRILEAHRDVLERTAKLLVEREVLEASELAELFEPARRSPAGELIEAAAPKVDSAPEGPGLVRRARRERLRNWPLGARPAFASTRRTSSAFASTRRSSRDG